MSDLNVLCIPGSNELANQCVGSYESFTPAFVCCFTSSYRCEQMLNHLRSRCVSCANRITNSTLLHEGLSKAHDLVPQAVAIVGELELRAKRPYLFP